MAPADAAASASAWQASGWRRFRVPSIPGTMIDIGNSVGSSLPSIHCFQTRRHVRAGLEQHGLDPELPGLVHPPGVHALAAHAVLVLGRRLQHGDARDPRGPARTRARRRRCPRRPRRRPMRPCHGPLPTRPDTRAVADCRRGSNPYCSPICGEAPMCPLNCISCRTGR